MIQRVSIVCGCFCKSLTGISYDLFCCDWNPVTVTNCKYINFATIVTVFYLFVTILCFLSLNTVVNQDYFLAVNIDRNFVQLKITRMIMLQMNVIERFKESFIHCSYLPAITDYFKHKTLTYKDVAASVAMYHMLFKECGIVKGDKIAIIGKNSSNWVVAYIATVTYGAVIVPILADFNPADAANIINHSQSKLLYADKTIWNSIKDFKFDTLIGAIDLESESVLQDFTENCICSLAYASRSEHFASLYPDGFNPCKLDFAKVKDDDLMIISYTSGTSGFSKGVMLSVKNISSNVNFALEHNFHVRGSRVLSLLPLAHAYGCAFDMLTPLSAGSHVTLLGKMPSPTVLLGALKDVRPNLLCSVPLVMEKIVRKSIVPKISKKPVSTLLRIPLISKFIYRKINKAMLDSFGGCLREVNLGGAPLSPFVEDILNKIQFPYTVGYGMTECGPLISYTPHEKYRSGSAGALLPGMEIKITDCENDSSIGEICVRGANVMLGYYRNPEATAQAIDKDGWLHTGDMGVVSQDGSISIKGRCKSMILSANGQNIYPEEIEAKLNNMEGVSESLVLEEKGRLVALVVPDFDDVKKRGLSLQAIKETMQENLNKLNRIVASYEKVSDVRICKEEFEKTPKRSIRRYLYPKQAKLWLSD